MSAQNDQFDFQFQSKFIAMMLGEAGFLERYGAIIEPNYFSDIYHQMLCEIINKYFRKYEACPTVEVIIEEIEKVKEQERRTMLSTTFEEVLNADLSDAGYYQDQAVSFCQRQSTLVALRSAAKELRDGNLDGVLPTIEKAMLIGQAMDAEALGIDYWQDFDKTEIIADEPKVPTLLGEPNGYGLDKVMRGGLMQGNVGLVQIPVGKGKSVFLMNIAGNAVLQSYNVVYISLELSERELLKRCNSFFSGLSTEKLSMMTSDEIRNSILKKYGNWKIGNFAIKTFPMMSVTVHQIESYLKTLKNKHGWSPDVVCIDYMDIIKPPFRQKEKYEQLVDVSQELKACAQRNKLPIWTAGQVNRAGAKKRKPDLEDAAGSYDKLFALDFVLAATPRVDEETEVRSADMKVCKNRQGPDQMTLGFDVDLDSMRFIYREREKETKGRKKQDEIFDHLKQLFATKD